MKPLVKICGITNLIDAKNALINGADFIGFVNIKNSPRFVTSQEIEDIVGQLSEEERNQVVLLTDINSVDSLVSFAGSVSAKIIQPYSSLGTMDLAKLKSLGFRIFQPVAVEDEDDLSAIAEYRDIVEALVLDTKSADSEQLGGTGKTFDWALFNKAKEIAKTKLCLAGGLNPENIEEAIRQCDPYMIDISSGLEQRPGIKSLEKIKELFRIVHLVHTA